jgi:hypothetical protein
VARLFFIEEWREYCRAFSPDLPKPFADITGILWLGVLLGKKVRLLSVPGVESRLPLIWVLLVSPPASLKTTAMHLLIQALPSVFIPITEDKDDFEEIPLHLELAGSPEGIIDHLALLSDKAVLLWVEEFVSILSATKRNTYSAEWRNFLLRAYHPSFSLTRSLRRQKIVIKNLMPHFISAITPQNLIDYGGLEEIRTGFLTRFLPIFVEETPKTASTPPPEEGNFWLRLIHDHAVQLMGYSFRDFVFTSEIEKRYKNLREKLNAIEYESDDEKIWVSRAFEFIPRSALLLSGAETDPDEEKCFILKECWDEAERMFFEYIIPSIKSILNFLSSGAYIYGELLRLIQWMMPKGEVTRSEIIRKFRWDKKMMGEIEQMAKDGGFIYIEDGYTRGQGRPEQRWRLISLPEEIQLKLEKEGGN